MSEGSPEKAIVFGREIEPDDMNDYRRKIDEAKKKGSVSGLKGTTPLGHVPRPPMPNLVKGAPANPASAFSPEGGVQPRPAGSPILTPQTQAQLEDLRRAQETEQKKEEEKKEVAEEKDDDLFSAFDFSARGEAERILNNKKRRKDIEARCKEMDIEDLLMKEEVRQVVPIVPGKFEVEFRSLTPVESLFIKQFMAEDASKPEAYYLERYSLCQLAMAVVAINGVPLGPPHMKADNTVDEKVFSTNLKTMVKKSGYVVADLGVQYAWFDIRVRKLLNPDALGNG